MFKSPQLEINCWHRKKQRT